MREDRGCAHYQSLAIICSVICIRGSVYYHVAMLSSNSSLLRTYGCIREWDSGPTLPYQSPIFQFISYFISLSYPWRSSCRSSILVFPLLSSTMFWSHVSLIFIYCFISHLYHNLSTLPYQQRSRTCNLCGSNWQTLGGRTTTLNHKVIDLIFGFGGSKLYNGAALPFDPLGCPLPQ